MQKVLRCAAPSQSFSPAKDKKSSVKPPTQKAEANLKSALQKNIGPGLAFCFTGEKETAVCADVLFQPE